MEHQTHRHGRDAKDQQPAQQVAAEAYYFLAAQCFFPPGQPLGIESSRALRRWAIAGQLYLSERTVENHVSSSLRKLGFSSRSEIAVWHALNRQPENNARER